MKRQTLIYKPANGLDRNTKIDKNDDKLWKNSRQKFNNRLENIISEYEEIAKSDNLLEIDWSDGKVCDRKGNTVEGTSLPVFGKAANDRFSKGETKEVLKLQEELNNEDNESDDDGSGIMSLGTEDEEDIGNIGHAHNLTDSSDSEFVLCGNNIFDNGAKHRKVISAKILPQSEEHSLKAGSVVFTKPTHSLPASETNNTSLSVQFPAEHLIEASPRLKDSHHKNATSAGLKTPPAGSNSKRNCNTPQINVEEVTPTVRRSSRKRKEVNYRDYFRKTRTLSEESEGTKKRFPVSAKSTPISITNSCCKSKSRKTGSRKTRASVQKPCQESSDEDDFQIQKLDNSRHNSRKFKNNSVIYTSSDQQDESMEIDPPEQLNSLSSPNESPESKQKPGIKTYPIKKAVICLYDDQALSKSPPENSSTPCNHLSHQGLQSMNKSLSPIKMNSISRSFMHSLGLPAGGNSNQIQCENGIKSYFKKNKHVEKQTGMVETKDNFSDSNFNNSISSHPELLNTNQSSKCIKQTFSETPTLTCDPRDMMHQKLNNKNRSNSTKNNLSVNFSSDEECLSEDYAIPQLSPPGDLYGNLGENKTSTSPYLSLNNVSFAEKVSGNNCFNMSGMERNTYCNKSVSSGILQSTGRKRVARTMDDSAIYKILSANKNLKNNCVSKRYRTSEKHKNSCKTILSGKRPSPILQELENLSPEESSSDTGNTTQCEPERAFQLFENKPSSSCYRQQGGMVYENDFMDTQLKSSSQQSHCQSPAFQNRCDGNSKITHPDLRKGEKSEQREMFQNTPVTNSSTRSTNCKFFQYVKKSQIAALEPVSSFTYSRQVALQNNDPPKQNMDIHSYKQRKWFQYISVIHDESTNLDTMPHSVSIKGNACNSMKPPCQSTEVVRKVQSKVVVPAYFGQFHQEKNYLTLNQKMALKYQQYISVMHGTGGAEC